MRLQLLPLFIVILISVATDYYIYKQIKNATKNKYARNFHIVSAAFLLIWIIVAIALPRRSGSETMIVTIMWMLCSYFAVYISKYIYLLISLIGKIPQIFKRKEVKLFQWAGIVCALICLFAIVKGLLVTPYKVDVVRQEIAYKNLPDSFDNFKIVQFSDFHVGTYHGDTTFVANVVDSINSLKPDLIVFTGDLVNRETTEAAPYLQIFSRLKAKYGVYSILGNHDYGDYKEWSSDAAKKKNNEDLYNFETSAGWKLLNNEHVYLKCNSDSVALIGVENWGEPPFPKYGDLNKAYPNVNDSVFKILLSHNPLHWKYVVLKESNIDLMLAGHTHAMQMEFDALGHRLSPSELRYKEWGGLYTNKEQNLYVNIGVGEVALPMRIGNATPEVTLITLKKK